MIGFLERRNIWPTRNSFRVKRVFFRTRKVRPTPSNSIRTMRWYPRAEGSGPRPSRNRPFPSRPATTPCFLFPLQVEDDPPFLQPQGEGGGAGRRRRDGQGRQVHPRRGQLAVQQRVAQQLQER